MEVKERDSNRKPKRCPGRFDATPSKEPFSVILKESEDRGREGWERNPTGPNQSVAETVVSAEKLLFTFCGHSSTLTNPVPRDTVGSLVTRP